MNRRKFLKNTLLASLASVFTPAISKSVISSNTSLLAKSKPVIISTWEHGLNANEAAWSVLKSGGSSLDAVEQGVMVSESDPECTSVGYGGLPDASGRVTLDACIMDYKGNCGSVSFLQDIKNPIAVARKVMENTPHVMLSGFGAYKFAIKQGFKKENLLTENSRNRWINWKKNQNSLLMKDNHDTIGMLAIDKSGNISGACTTSGLAWKMHGRVGDSPIIGAGLYVDNEIGGACATGVGECVMKSVGSFLIVELMRSGFSPQQACEEAIRRIIANQKYQDAQVGYLAINKQGEYGAYSIKQGFKYALHYKRKNNLLDAEFAN